MSFFAEQHSYYFQRQLRAGWINVQKLEQLCYKPLSHAIIEQLLSEYSLRRARTLILMTLMERDLQGRADLEEVCQAMTFLAERACTLCFQAAALELSERFGRPLDKVGRPQDLMVIAMGKAGAYELNVSSDLDLILVYRDDGQTVGLENGSSSLSASEFFHQVARQAIKALSEMNEEGFVFRIDTRLRPNGDSGPLVLSLPMLEEYFLVQGREWERFAWLKSRVICDTGLQQLAGLDAMLDRQDLSSLVDPFVFRRYIDYRIFDGLKNLHQTIRQEAGKKDLKSPGTIDIKLGEGGIREIEFIAQMFQIVRGGRDPGLRDPATQTTLDTLAARKLLSPSETSALIEAYRLFRRIEHALQYVDDQQTHRIPASGEGRDKIALMLGLSGEFDTQLTKARHLVQTIFEALLKDPATEHSPDEAGPHPLEAGLSEAVKHRLEAFRASARFRSSSVETQEALKLLFARAMDWVHWSVDKQEAGARDELTLVRLIDFAEVVCRRPSYIALVARFPLAFERVLEILSQSSWGANYLNQHPIVLDELLDGRLLDPPDLVQWQQQLKLELASPSRPTKAESGPDIERQMDTAREVHHALVFKLLAQDLKGLWTLERLSDQLSEAADRCLQSAMDLIWQQLPKKFRDTPRLAAIAYGKLGGKELGYASDLDLVFIHDDEDERAQEAYAQYAQRISSWLSTRTRAGLLFEIDLRLRPNGNAGLLVTSVQGFKRYQLERAWTWELQALTRARFSAGDAQIGQVFEAMRVELICKPRELGPLKAEVLAMRQKMLDGHPNKTPLFDIKHDRGGMVDIEFMVQYLVLAHAHQDEALAKNLGNIALLAIAASHGLIPADESLACQEAYRSYRKRQHSLRLNDQEFARVPPTDLATERGVVLQLWNGLFELVP
jgi:[glutamine synthetase] adenylyltransferase / [glutamine synthetase]-adenylyl-L-tyrosine phosphorylase